MFTQADIDWVFLDSVDSTNTYLMQAYVAGLRHGLVAVLAQEQTQGRGRAGRTWVAEPGASLCLSIGLPLDCSEMPFLPLCVGVGIAQSLQSLGVGVSLKWPNDVLIQGQKLAGVLCEGGQSTQGGFTVVGIGLNIQPVCLPNALVGVPPTALMNHWPSYRPLPDARALAYRLVPSVVSAIELGRRSGLEDIAAWFSQRDAFVGRPVEVSDRGQVLMQGMALGLAPDGAYRIQTAHGERRVYVGDVSLRVKDQ
jgi:BirA family biotin operon repressor/biotin-[acetyl-CoA-carboxylase] ligase